MMQNALRVRVVSATFPDAFRQTNTGVPIDVYNYIGVPFFYQLAYHLAIGVL